MKSRSRLLLFFLAIAISCDTKTKTASPDASDSLAKVTAEAEKIKAAAEVSEKTKDGLSKLLPLTEAELKALLPSMLMGATQSDAEVRNSSGALAASAEYEISDSSSVTLNIIDCAGPEGSGIYNMQFLTMANANEENDEEYTKPTTVNGNKAIEHCDKTNNDCSITWFSNRFLITLEGENTGAAKLKQAAADLKIR